MLKLQELFFCRVFCCSLEAENYDVTKRIKTVSLIEIANEAFRAVRIPQIKLWLLPSAGNF